MTRPHQPNRFLTSNPLPRRSGRGRQLDRRLDSCRAPPSPPARPESADPRRRRRHRHAGPPCDRRQHDGSSPDHAALVPRSQTVPARPGVPVRRRTSGSRREPSCPSDLRADDDRPDARLSARRARPPDARPLGRRTTAPFQRLDAARWHAAAIRGRLATDATRSYPSSEQSRRSCPPFGEQTTHRGYETGTRERARTITCGHYRHIPMMDFQDKRARR